MRYFTPEYWDRFTKIDYRGKLIRDGESFEDLIEVLLDLEYGQKWYRTGKSHDDNRDFSIYFENEKIWAECKNYREVIAMDIIAPTLVMAQIYDVNKLVFFSYSRFNSQAKRKIFSFGNKVSKEIQIIDDYLIEELIIKHLDRLPVKFVPEVIIEKEIKSDDKVQIDFYFGQHPTFASSFEDNNYVRLSGATKLIYNEPFEISFMIQNTSITDFIRADVEILQIDDNSNYMVLDIESFSLDNYKKSVFLESSEGNFIQIYFKPNIFKPQLLLPVIKINVYNQIDELVKTVQSEQSVLPCQWIGRTKLIGSNYYNILNKFESKLLDNGKLSSLTLFGKSGTGKTRLLTETINLLLKHKYRVLSFIGSENMSSAVIIREIIYFAYEIPRKEILEMVESRLLDHEAYPKSNNPAYNIIMAFNDALTEEELEVNLTKYSSVLFEKLSTIKVCIIIDNVQFFGTSIAKLLTQFLQYGLNQYRRNNMVIISSFNEDFITTDSMKVLNLIKVLKDDNYTYQCFPIEGFQCKGQGVLFLRELLNVSNELMDELFEEIINKVSLRPYYLYQTIYYLNEHGAILQNESGRGYIVDFSSIEKAIHHMPPSIHEIIFKRWQRMSPSHSVLEIALVHFFREIDPPLITNLRLNEKNFQALLDKSFLTYKSIDYSNIIIFDHDIIEKFFMKQYPDLGMKAINYIVDNDLINSLNINSPQYILCNLFLKDINSTFIVEASKRINELNIPPQLNNLFYVNWFKIILYRHSDFETIDTWIGAVKNICGNIRNKLDLSVTERLFKEADAHIATIKSEVLSYPDNYRRFVNLYADVLYSIDSEKSTNYLIKIFNQAKAMKKTCVDDDLWYSFMSLICNRLHTNYRIKHSTYCQEKQVEYLDLAKSYASKIKNKILKNERDYYNYSDEGYLYYCYNNDLPKLLNTWNHCISFSLDEIPSKTLNYYRKQVQLHIIKQDITDALITLDRMEEYLYTGEYAHDIPVFEFFIAISRASCYLIENNSLQFKHINQLLNKASQLYPLLKKDKLIGVYLLKALLAFYQNDSFQVYACYRQALVLMNQNKDRLFSTELRLLVYDNLIISFRKFNIFNKPYNFDFLDSSFYKYSEPIIKLSDTEFEQFLTTYEAKGIIRTKDLMFNLPLLK